MEDVRSKSNFLHDFETKMQNLGDWIRMKSDAFSALPSPQCLLPSTFTTSALPAIIIIFQAAILLHIGTTQAINILPQSPDARLPLEGHVGPDKRPINRKFPIFSTIPSHKHTNNYRTRTVRRCGGFPLFSSYCPEKAHSIAPKATLTSICCCK